ncbi:MAG: trypsin-like peptidase domain-containing protein [Candidatus Marinimicrobia bacterium]|nr:trypsin-like peptidase domain-containing protein [Candidatus Neomarinimicrobiota bacterium]MBL7023151.1 trypsin-like peptidase domain-containing protein [Candidatus Neomarinimicrobiota bacterium]MBL7109041.1 trypsin-like peptidase domain-containing protein [Candidatus Neomarinimicrobiota bacterium]
MKTKYRLIMAMILFFMIGSFGWSQLNQGGEPYSSQFEVRSEIQLITMPPIDTEKLFAEDEVRPVGTPFRYGHKFLVDYSMDNSGTWETLKNGDKIWRLAIISENAYAISLEYKDFYLPNGSSFFVYNEDYEMVYGAYTELNNSEDRIFATPLVAGDMTILEYYHPANSNRSATINISEIIHDYRDIMNFSNSDRDRACGINVVCSEASPYQEQIDAASWLDMGGYICSGSMVNNTSQDLTPYFLTADHCVDGENPGTFRFYFNYETTSCSGTYASYGSYAYSSSTKARSYDMSPDFALLEINDNIPDSWNVFYAGWDNSGSTPQISVGVHHPGGDPKKINFDNDYASSSNWNGGPWGTHWMLEWDSGGTAGGSSGSPVFNSAGRVVGQLSGGPDLPCEDPNTYDLYGKFSYGWDGSSSSTRLKDWLDPTNSGATTLDGTYNGIVEPVITVTDPNGGEDWELGTSHPITWTSSNTGNYVKIQLYKNSSFYAIITNSTSDDGSYSWTIPESYELSSYYKIKISDTGNTATYDYSNSNFTLSAPPSLTVTAPNGGEDWEVGTSNNISWTSVNLSSNIKIQLYQGTSYYATIVSNTTNDGSYPWVIPSDYDIADNYRVKILDSNTSSVYDYSDSYFSLTAVPVADITVDPVSFTQLLSTNETANQTLQITNSGGSGSTLSYSLSVSSGNWLSVNPSSGSCNAGEIDNISVAFDSGSLAEGTYSSSIEIAHNAGATISVPVTLTVEGGAQPPNYPDWIVDVPQYEFNLTLAGLLFIEGEESVDENDLLGAFVGNECRGVASPSYFPVTGRYTVNMMIYSNQSSGEEMSFKAYDYSEDFVYTQVTETIEFTANDIIGNDIEPFDVHAILNPNYPNWSVDVPLYEFNLTLAGLLSIEGEESIDENDLLGAFVGTECRGIANPSYFPVTGRYTVNMMIYSNQSSGETVAFKIYDYSDDLVYENINQSITFVANDIIGNDIDPLEFSTTSSVQISLSFAAGWNWFSVNVSGDDMSLNTVLASLGTNAEMIKNQTGFATYYADFGWYGLDFIDVTSMYMIQMIVDGSLDFEGSPADYINLPIELVGGWNWIGYLPQQANNLNSALESIGANGEMIKNQTGFATYYEGFGWYGLDFMNPGDGYMLDMLTGSTLIYGTPELMKISLPNESDLHWFVNPHNYEHNMTATATVNSISDGDVLGIFSGEECRGVVQATKFPLSGKYTFNLMIYGENGDELNFRYFNADSEEEYVISENIQFEVNANLGNDLEPILLRSDSEVIVDNFSLIGNYPNPFNPSTTISYQLQAPSSVLLSIYNMNGQLVDKLVSTGSIQEAGYHEVVWDASEYSSGIYFAKLQVSSFTETQKLLLIK